MTKTNKIKEVRVGMITYIMIPKSNYEQLKQQLEEKQEELEKLQKQWYKIKS